MQPCQFPVTANSSKVRTEREGVEEKGNGKRLIKEGRADAEKEKGKRTKEGV